MSTTSILGQEPDSSVMAQCFFMNHPDSGAWCRVDVVRLAAQAGVTCVEGPPCRWEVGEKSLRRRSVVRSKTKWLTTKRFLTGFSGKGGFERKRILGMEERRPPEPWSGLHPGTDSRGPECVSQHTSACNLHTCRCFVCRHPWRHRCRARQRVRGSWPLHHCSRNGPTRAGQAS